jgi:hypothetical protein
MPSVFVSFLPFDWFDFSKTFAILLDVEFMCGLLLAWFLTIFTNWFFYVLLLLLLQSALQPLVGFWPAQMPFSILSRKVLQGAVTSGTSNPQLGGEPGI